jgi:hypothetical protein
MRARVRQIFPLQVDLRAAEMLAQARVSSSSAGINVSGTKRPPKSPK